LAIFAPSPQNNVPAGAPVTMSVTIQSQTLSAFDSADVVINSDVPFAFTYSPDFVARSTGYLTTPIALDLGLRTHDLYVGGGSLTHLAYGNSIQLGTITFDTSSLSPGNYDVIISSKDDFGITIILTYFGANEPLEGQGFFSIAPAVPAVDSAGLGVMLALGCAFAAYIFRRSVRFTS
jgi:hypothetical protein